MGYTLHITRKEGWSDDTGPVIDEAEWRRIIEEDPELTLDLDTRCVMTNGEFIFAAWKTEPGAMGWYHGEITAKNPDEALIAKMVRIAQKLDATVQGDDGEIYREDGSSFEPGVRAATASRLNMMNRIASWFQHRRTTRELQEAAPRFRAGDRVKGFMGRLGTVVEVDRRANHGIGSVRVRFDDGREATFAYVASGLEIINEEASPK
jgi:hypothetical protein